MTRALIVAAFVFIAAACSSGDDGRANDSYFTELAPVMRSYHDQLAGHRATWPGMDTARLSAAYYAYAQSLDDFGANLDDVVPSRKADDAHERLVGATRTLADVYRDRAAALSGESATATATPDGGEESDVSSGWFTACHDLQDMALVDEIEVDLLCVTMLGANTESME